MALKLECTGIASQMAGYEVECEGFESQMSRIRESDDTLQKFDGDSLYFALHILTLIVLQGGTGGSTCRQQ